MKKIFSLLPIELYVLVVPSIFIILLSTVWLKNFSLNAFGVGEFLASTLDRGTPFFLFGILLLSLLPSLLIIGAIFRTVNKKSGERPIINGFKNILSIFFVLFTISFAMYSLMMLTNALLQLADPIKAAKFGNMAMHWDKAIFKTNPGVWLINKFSNTFVETALIWTYNSLFIILSLILLISFFTKKDVFRRLTLSFFICWMIAFPIWFSLPMMPPDFTFRQNKLGSASLEDNTAFNNFPMSENLKVALDSLSKIHIVKISPTEKSLPVSTFPSMHAAWGFIIAYMGTILCPWLGILLIPWAILNGFGAVYVLEHYSVDIFLGTAVAIFSILLTEILLHIEKKYLKDKLGLLRIFDRVYIKSWIKDMLDNVAKISRMGIKARQADQNKN